MKSVLAVAAMMASCYPAGAIELQTPVMKQLYTCAKPGMSRVAVVNDPAPCCDGQLKCAQFLSTTGMLQARRNLRT